jgi:NAD(P)-dependent dehydrogenase (short-subunit alcohol dehydrogenase family)
MAVIVTGASSGIGHAVAVACAREGAHVLASGRNADALAETALAAGGDMAVHAADLTVAGAADDMVADALDRFGRLEGIVHCAGTIRRGEDVRDTTDEQWQQLLDENLTASFAVARAAVRAMTHGGSVVLLGSQLAHIAAPGNASYVANKGGIEALVRALAVDHGPAGIRVNALSPGLVHTHMSYVDRADFASRIEEFAARHPLRRIGAPEDIAGPAVFLLSPASAWMTGQSLVVDGGFTIQ